MDRLPDFVETHLREMSYFTFLLPVTAFGYQDDMIMEVSVEYGLSGDRTHYQANVWARQDRSHTKHMIYTLSVPAAGGPAPDEIFSALNSDDGFDSVMHDYIYEAAKHRE